MGSRLNLIPLVQNSGQNIFLKMKSEYFGSEIKASLSISTSTAQGPLRSKHTEDWRGYALLQMTVKAGPLAFILIQLDCIFCLPSKVTHQNFASELGNLRVAHARKCWD